MRAETLKPHRVLWLTEHYPPGRGGMAVSCDRIVFGLRRAGVMLDLVHLRRAALEETNFPREGGRDILVRAGPDVPHALASLWSGLERENAGWTHVVAFGGTLPFIAGPAYAAWLGVPLITCLRGNDFDTGVFAGDRRHFLEDAIHRAARVGCVTDNQRRRVQRLFAGSQTVWTPNGIDTDEWNLLPSDLRRADDFRTGHVGPGRTVLGLFGDLKPKKGVETLLAAITLAACADHLHLLLAGTPPEGFLDRVPAGCATTVLPAMPRTDLIPYLLACDAIALPSLYEGFPNLLLEAAALGVPLLASDAGAAGVLEDGTHGALFRAGDAADCAIALGRTLAPHADWREACIEVAARFSAAHERDTYLQLLDETAAPLAARVASIGLSARPGQRQ